MNKRAYEIRNYCANTKNFRVLEIVLISFGSIGSHISKNLMQVVQFLHNLHQQLAWSQIMTGFLKAKFLTNYFYLISEGTKSHTTTSLHYNMRIILRSISLKAKLLLTNSFFGVINSKAALNEWVFKWVFFTIRIKISINLVIFAFCENIIPPRICEQLNFESSSL